MQHHLLTSGWTRSVGLAAAILALWSPVLHGQIVTDGTLGPAGPLIGPNFDIPASLGRQSGPNLFHSFSQFNLQSGESANFSGPATTENVLARVTGTSASFINGRLSSSIEGANLFLLNPNGVMFGPEATLDLTGSFAVSSASHVTLADGGRFDAVNPAASTLTVAAPVAFGFHTPRPAAVQVDGATLDLDGPNAEGSIPGRKLVVIGGDVEIRGGLLRAEGGEIDIVSADSSGTVPLDLAGSDGARGGTVRLQGGTLLAQRVALRAGEIVADNANVESDNVARGVAAGLDIQARGRMDLLNGSQFTSSAGQVGAGGEINVKAGTLRLEGSTSSEAFTSIRSDSFGAEGGNVRVQAGHVSVGEASEIASISSFGRSGDVRLDVGNLVVRDGGVIGATSFNGTPGNVTIAAENVELRGGSTLGTVQFSSPQLSGEPGAGFGPSTLPGPTGPGGNISLKADDTIFIRDSVISTTIGAGAGGNINVSAGTLFFADNAAVTAVSAGAGANINVASPFAVIDQTFLSAAATAPVNGRIVVTACILDFQDNIVSSTAGFFADVLNCDPPLRPENFPRTPESSWPELPPLQDWPGTGLAFFLPDPLGRPPLAAECGVRYDLNSFIHRHRGGRALVPGGWQPGLGIEPPGRRVE